MDENVNKIIDDLNQCKTITERLNYWEENLYPKYEYTSGCYDGNFKHIPDPVFADFETETIHTLLKIPKEIYENYFEDGFLNTEYCYWFLKFDAKFYCKHALIPNFEKKCNNPLKIEFLIAEINELRAIEEQATSDFLNKKFDIYRANIDPKFEKQIILKRIQSSYYERIRFEGVHTFGDKTVITYANHLYFKSHLIEELKKESFDEYQKLYSDSNISSFESLLLESIQDLSTKPKNFNNEDEIRSHFFYIISASLRNNAYVTIESYSRKGRTDLLVSGDYGRIIVEFKIWKRNNYRKIVNQLIGYLTDFEKEGYIIVLNKSDKPIDEEYIKTISGKQTSIIGEVNKFKYKKTSYEYYKSTHKIDLKPKIVTHFIHNETQ